MMIRVVRVYWASLSRRADQFLRRRQILGSRLHDVGRDPLQLGAAERLDVHVETCRLGQELRVLHRAVEGLPKNVDALARDTGRREQRAAEGGAGADKQEN